MILTNSEYILIHGFTITLSVINCIACFLQLLVFLKRKDWNTRTILPAQLSLYVALHSITFFFIFSKESYFCIFIGSLHTAAIVISITCADSIVLVYFLTFQNPEVNVVQKPFIKYGLPLICPLLFILFLLILYFTGNITIQYTNQCRLEGDILSLIYSIYCGLLVTFSIILVIILIVKIIHKKKTGNVRQYFVKELTLYILGQIFVYSNYITYLLKIYAYPNNVTMIIIDKVFELITPFIFISVYGFNRALRQDLKNIIFCCYKNNSEIEFISGDGEITLVEME